MRIYGNVKYKSRNLFFQVRNISYKGKKPNLTFFGISGAGDRRPLYSQIKWMN